MLSETDVKWFQQYSPTFYPNPQALSAKAEFKRLAVGRNWKIGGSRYLKAKWSFDARHNNMSAATSTADDLAIGLDALALHESDLTTASASSCATSVAEGVSLQQHLSPNASRLPTPSPKEKSSKAPPSSSSQHASHRATTRGSRGDQDFFSGFAGFVRDHSKNLASEFDRLAQSQGWPKSSKTWRSYRAECYKQQFENVFGKATNNLEAWQELCRDLMVGTVPTSVAQCKKLLNNVHVNLFDFIECKYSDKAIAPMFSTVRALQQHSENDRRIFPKRLAKDNLLLQVLLKRISNYS